MAQGILKTIVAAMSQAMVPMCLETSRRSIGQPTGIEDLERLLDGRIRGQRHDRLASLQAIVAARNAGKLFLDHRGDQALPRQIQIGQDMLGGRCAGHDIDFEDRDRAVAERCPRDEWPAIEESQDLAGHDFAGADGKIDAEFADDVGIVGTADDGHDRLGAQFTRPRHRP